MFDVLTLEVTEEYSVFPMVKWSNWPGFGPGFDAVVAVCGSNFNCCFACNTHHEERS